MKKVKIASDNTDLKNYLQAEHEKTECLKKMGKAIECKKKEISEAHWAVTCWINSYPGFSSEKRSVLLIGELRICNDALASKIARKAYKKLTTENVDEKFHNVTQYSDEANKKINLSGDKAFRYKIAGNGSIHTESSLTRPKPKELRSDDRHKPDRVTDREWQLAMVEKNARKRCVITVPDKPQKLYGYIRDAYCKILGHKKVAHIEDEVQDYIEEWEDCRYDDSNYYDEE